MFDRTVARSTLFEKPEDDEAFDRVLTEAVARIPLPIFSYCLMPNHWHFVVLTKVAITLRVMFCDSLLPPASTSTFDMEAKWGTAESPHRPLQAETVDYRPVHTGRSPNRKSDLASGMRQLPEYEGSVKGQLGIILLESERLTAGLVLIGFVGSFGSPGDHLWSVIGSAGASPSR